MFTILNEKNLMSLKLTLTIENPFILNSTDLLKTYLMQWFYIPAEMYFIRNSYQGKSIFCSIIPSLVAVNSNATKRHFWADLTAEKWI